MKQEIFVNSIKLLISKIIPIVSLSLIAIIYSWELPPEDYGAYQAIWTYLSVAVVFTTFGLPSYLLTYSNNLSSKALHKAIFLTSIVFLVVLIPISIFLFFSNNFDLQTILFFLILLVSHSIFLVQESYLISKRENKRLVIVNFYYTLLLLLSHLFIIYVIKYKLVYCLLSIIFISIARNIFIYKKSKEPKSTNELISSPPPSLNLLFWLGINNSLQIITKWMDKLFLLFLLPVTEYAIYFNGTYELPLIGTLLLTFQSIITIHGSMDSEDKSNLLELFGSSAIFMSGILFPIFSWMFLYADQIVVVLFSNKYKESITLFAISALIIPARICSYTLLLQLKNKGNIILLGSILDFVLAIILMFILYPIFNLNGIILSTIIATYIQIGYYLFMTAKIFNISVLKILPYKKLTTRLALNFLLILAIKNLFFFVSPVNNFVLGLFVTLVILLFYINKSFSLINIGRHWLGRL